jgi:PAS domain-containing protein
VEARRLSGGEPLCCLRLEGAGPGEASDLERQAADLRQLYETLPVGLCLLDTNLRFVHLNERLAAINGRPVAEHVGRTVADVAPDIAAAVEPAARRLLETGEPVLDLELRAGRPWAEPNRGDRGATFLFRLPLAPPALAEEAGRLGGWAPDSSTA